MGIVNVDTGIVEIFDTREDGLRCVRFESGEVGVVDVQGKVIFAKRKFKHVEFAEHDFVKLICSKMEVLMSPELRYMVRDGGCIHDFYVDLKSGQMFGSMPELQRYGNFEVAFFCGSMFTRTRKCYIEENYPSFVFSAGNGLYLVITHSCVPEKEMEGKMLYRHRYYRRCLVKGDEAEAYWLMVEFDDESVVVMDDEGMYYYVRLDKKTGKAVWRELGKGDNIAEKSMIHMCIKDIRMEVRKRMEMDEKEAKRTAERKRKKGIKALTSAVPFQIGNKWGLKLDGRIVVPAIYRKINEPVGKYCAVELYPGSWGVMAVDGKMEIDAKYEGVEIRPNGTVKLTQYGGKVVSKKLP